MTFAVLLGIIPPLFFYLVESFALARALREGDRVAAPYVPIAILLSALAVCALTRPAFAAPPSPSKSKSTIKLLSAPDSKPPADTVIESDSIPQDDGLPELFPLYRHRQKATTSHKNLNKLRIRSTTTLPNRNLTAEPAPESDTYFSKLHVARPQALFNRRPQRRHRRPTRRHQLAQSSILSRRRPRHRLGHEADRAGYHHRHRYVWRHLRRLRLGLLLGHRGGVAARDTGVDQRRSSRLRSRRPNGDLVRKHDVLPVGRFGLPPILALRHWRNGNRLSGPTTATVATKLCGLFPSASASSIPIRRWLATRAEITDQIGIGNNGVNSQHDFTLTFALEWRFGAHPRSYWPWNPSRHIW